MTINTLVIEIKDAEGKLQLRPLYEVHSWDKAEEIIANTKKLIAEGSNPTWTFSFSVEGWGR